MKKKIASIIARKLEENIEIVSTKKTRLQRVTDGSEGTVDYPDEKFFENRSQLFHLLSNHPYFQKQVKKIRGVYKLPEAGLESLQNAFVWENKSKARYDHFVKDIDLLLLDFNISKVYRSSVWQFAYDYILCPKRAENNPISHYPIFSITHTDEDRDINKFLINPNSLYIEIFEWTTKRDIEKALKKITQLKKEKLPLKVSKIGDLARKVWLLSKEGLNDHKIASEIAKAILGGKREFGYADVAVYRKRYKDALSTLRKL